MKNVAILLLFLTFFLVISCNQTKKKEKLLKDNLITIDINQVKDCEMDDLFSKIELIPLETNDSSIVGKLNRVIYTDDKKFIYFDDRNRTTVFNKNGAFISNSSKVDRGKGPMEYYVVLDIVFNQFSNTIEILGPDRNILIYDTLFNFVGRKKIKIPNEILYYYFYPISNDIYALMPTELAKNPYVVTFYDFKKNKVIKELTYNNIFSRLSMTEFSIRSVGSNFYFSPASTTYYGYSIDCKELTLNPIFHFDFGKNNIDLNDLNRFHDYREVTNYLMTESSYPLPLRNLFNEKYIVSSIKMKNDFLTFIYNLNTGEKIFVKNKYSNKLRAPQYFTIEDNVLFAIVQPYELGKYVDIKLLDKNEKFNFENMSEDNNPVIVKYFLK